MSSERGRRTLSGTLVPLALLACFGGVFACEDYGAIIVVQPDAGLPSVDAGPTPCDECISAPSMPGPGCGDQDSACRADPTCAMDLACQAAQGCGLLPTSTQVYSCNIGCDAQLHLTSSDNSALLSYARFKCRISTCGSVCNPGEVIDSGLITLAQAGATCDANTNCGPGLYCCGTLNGSTYSSIQCQASCSDANQYEICNPSNPTPCHFKGSCVPSIYLSNGHVCR